VREEIQGRLGHLCKHFLPAVGEATGLSLHNQLEPKKKNVAGIWKDKGWGLIKRGPIGDLKVLKVHPLILKKGHNAALPCHFKHGRYRTNKEKRGLKKRTRGTGTGSYNGERSRCNKKQLQGLGRSEQSESGVCIGVGRGGEILVGEKAGKR